MTRAYFVSDLHLKTIEERNSQTLLRFFRSMIPSSAESALRPATFPLATHIFLVGDIFDLWIGEHTFFIDRFRPLIEVIRETVNAGIQVHFFEGNHDLYLREFWEGQLGVHVHPDEAYFDLAGQTVRVEHGDLINPEDKGYLFLRGFLRSKTMVWLARNLPSRAIKFIGERASRASREYTSTAKELPKDRIRPLIRRHAEAVYLHKPFDLLITGHVHVVDDHVFSAQEKNVRSVNLGSWFDEPKTFLLTDEPTQSGFLQL